MLAVNCTVGVAHVVVKEFGLIVTVGITVLETTTILALPTQPFTVFVITTEYVPPLETVGVETEVPVNPAFGVQL